MPIFSLPSSNNRLYAVTTRINAGFDSNRKSMQCILVRDKTSKRYPTNQQLSINSVDVAFHETVGKPAVGSGNTRPSVYVNY